MSSSTLTKVYRYLCVGIFVLIALGGGVRTMNAGLACPDWPLCFGDIIPDYHPEVYFEFIHRVLAGIIGIVSVTLNIMIIRNKNIRLNVRLLAGLSIFLLFMQVIMGGLTVLLMLHDKIVAMHLALGTGFFAISLWIYQSLKFYSDPDWQKESLVSDARRMKHVALLALVAVYIQILLGGLVASNYAALVCPEFPLCHGEWIPTLKGSIGLQVIHRLGAYTLTAILLFTFYFAFKNVKCGYQRRLAKWMLVTIFIQVSIGIANVLLAAPPLLAVLHLATGTFLLSIVVRMFRRAKVPGTNLGYAAQ